MNLLGRMGAALSAAGDAWSRSTQVLDPRNDERWLETWGGAATSSSGMSVSETTALNTAAVYSCVSILAGIQSSLPCHLVQKEDGGTERLANDARDYLLHEQPNDEYDSGKLRELMTVGELLWGNGHAIPDITPRGQVEAIWGVTSDRLSYSRDSTTRRVVYGVMSDNGTSVDIPQWRMIHSSALGYDGIVGKSRIGLHREALGLAAALERHGAEFFGQGARPGPVVTSPKRMTWKQASNIEKYISKRRGPGQFSRPLALGEGLTVSEYSMPHDDAQFLETRQFQLAEIARMFGMPLWMVGAREGALGTALESEMMAFVVLHVAPRCLHWERAVAAKICTPEERRRGMRVFLDLRGLLRASYMTRISGYASAIQNGWMTRNEVRAFEDMNRGPDELNTFLVSTGGQGLSVPAGAPQQTGGPNERQRQAVAGAYTATWARILRRGRQDWARVEAGKLDRDAWRGEIVAYATEQLGPVARTWEAVGGHPSSDVLPVEAACGLDGDVELAAQHAAAWSMGWRQEAET